MTLAEDPKASKNIPTQLSGLKYQITLPSKLDLSRNILLHWQSLNFS